MDVLGHGPYLRKLADVGMEVDIATTAAALASMVFGSEFETSMKE